MKNTMGYGLNALLDFDDPCQILAHLIVGSEGTLGFVAEVTLRTIPVRAHVSSVLLLFDDLDAANRALPDLVDTGAATLELMDARSCGSASVFPTLRSRSPRWTSPGRRRCCSNTSAPQGMNSPR